MGILYRGLKNAFRNTIRTGSIIFILALAVGLSLTMLLSLQAVQSKIDSVKSSIGNLITVSPAGVRGFEGGGNPLLTTDLAPIKNIAHVVSITETNRGRMTSSDTNLQNSLTAGVLGGRAGRFFGQNGDGNFTPPIQVIGTTDPTTLNAAGGGTANLTAGKLVDGNSSDKTADLGKDLAGKNNLSVGSTFQAYGQTVTLAGIFDAGNTFSNSIVLMPLATLDSLSGQTNEVSAATVTVDSISNVDSTVTAIKNALGDKADVVSEQDSSSNALAPLESIQNISLYSLVGSIAAAAVILLLLMLMIVRERRREIGVLKAIGASNLTIIGQFVTEALTLTLIGSAIGTVLGAVFSNGVTQLLLANAVGSTQQGGPGAFRQAFRTLSANPRGLLQLHTNVDYHILIYGLAASVLIAVLGSAIPAYLTAKIRPADVLRSE